MPLAYAATRCISHGGQALGRRFEALDHCAGQFFDIAGSEEPARLARPDQFRDACDIGRKYRSSQGHGLHQHHRQALGKARQNQGASGGNLGLHLLAADPSGDAHVRVQAERVDQRLDRRAHFTVSGQHQIAGVAPAQYRGERAYEQQLALLLAQTPYANERGIRGEGRAIHIEEARIEPAVHDVHLRPLGGVDPAIHLAAPERADGHDEGGTLRLFGQADELSLIELFWPVHREAVRHSAEARSQHRHLG